MKYNVLIAFLPVLLLLAGSRKKKTEEEKIN